MKNKSLLLKDLKFRKIRLLITLPVSMVAALVVAIVLIVTVPQIWWVGLITIGVDVISIPIVIWGIKYINTEIKELEELEEFKNSKETADKNVEE